MDERLDFEKTVQQFHALSNKAKVTLMYRLLKGLGPQVLRFIIRRCCENLDNYNKSLADSDPLKKRYLKYGRHNQSKNAGYDRKDLPDNEPGGKPLREG